MPHFRTMMKPSDTLKAYDLIGKDGKPRDYTLKIVRVTQGKVSSADKPKGDKMPFIYFQGATKPLGGNVTNCEMISSIVGSKNTDDWPGHSVTLYATMVKSIKGEMVEAVRVRPRKPTAVAEDLPDVPVDEAMLARQEAAAREPGED